MSDERGKRAKLVQTAAAAEAERRRIQAEAERRRTAAEQRRIQAAAEAEQRRAADEQRREEAAQRRAEQLRAQVAVDARESAHRPSQEARVAGFEAQRKKAEQKSNIILSLINLSKIASERAGFTGYEIGFGIHGTGDFIRFKKDILFKMNNSHLGVDLTEDFLNWDNTIKVRSHYCYICGYRLQRANDQYSNPTLNTQGDHVLEFSLSAGFLGHGSRNVIRPVHRHCNNPIKSNPGEHRISGANFNSGLLGWGILNPPYIDYNGRINTWSLNNERANLLRTTAQRKISGLGDPFTYLEGEESPPALHETVRSDLGTYGSIIHELNSTRMYGAGDLSPGLKILTNERFRTRFINPEKYSELIKLLGVGVIDKFIYGLIVTTCMKLNPGGSDILGSIFRDPDFQMAVKNVLGPYYGGTTGSEGSTRGGPGGAGPSSEPGNGFGKKRNGLKYTLKRLRMDLKKVK